MDELLTKLLENEVLSDETKKEVSEGFKRLLDEARVDIENKVRGEFAERYETDKTKIAEAVERYVDQRMEQEIVEFHTDLKALGEQRMKYVNATAALKEQAQSAIRTRLAIFEKALKKAMLKETKELHADLKTNRAAAIRTINEAKAQAAADRETFKVKGARVLEHIINTKLQSQLTEMKADIDKAMQNDFGNRIFETFMGEARRLFFNSHKELRGMMKHINEQAAAYKAEKAQLVKQLQEAQEIAKRALNENRTIKESAVRTRRMSQLLATIPQGKARDQMRTLLESSATADLDRTFKKYASTILTEAPVKSKSKSPLTEGNPGIRTGNGGIVANNTVDDDEEIVQLRHLAGIVRR